VYLQWCQEECYDDPIAKRVMERMSNITGIPEENQEYLQLLRYGPTQYYHVHNDYIEVSFVLSLPPTTPPSGSGIVLATVLIADVR